LGIPFEELRFDEGGGVYGVEELPVAWDDNSCVSRRGTEK
jgi:hypothetical protein